MPHNLGLDRFRITAEDQDAYRALCERMDRLEEDKFAVWDAYQNLPPKQLRSTFRVVRGGKE